MQQEIFDNVWLPSFPGFYGTWFSALDRLEDVDLNEELESDIDTNDMWDYFDGNAYMADVGASCCSTIEDRLSEIFGDIITVTYSGIDSPRYYNFENDQLKADICINDVVIFNKTFGHWIAAHRDYIESRIKADFTSHDGFISFHTNDFKQFMQQAYMGGTKWNFLLSYIMEYEDYNEEFDFCYHLYEQCEVYPECYFNIPDKVDHAA